MSDSENYASVLNTKGNRGGSSPDRGYRDKSTSRGPDDERLRIRKRDGERKGFHEHHLRDYKDGGFRGRGNYDHHRIRNRDRHHGHVRDGEMRHRHGRHSSYRSRRESRSRSRSPSRSESKRTSGFDMAPAAVTAMPAAVLPGNLALHVPPSYLSAYGL